jgi:hypothetical protein
LGIPYLTLLDLDLGRTGGGWGRIKYVLEQLLELGVDENKLLDPIGRAGLSTMHTSPSGALSENLQSWMTFLETHHVYFSSPLDLDFSMLQAFPAAYQKLEVGENGPQKSSDDAVIAAVLSEKSNAGPYYQSLGIDSLRWYRYLFLGRGKPATHALALGRVKDKKLAKSAPAWLTRFVERIRAKIDPDFLHFP